MFFYKNLISFYQGDEYVSTLPPGTHRVTLRTMHVLDGHQISMHIILKSLFN
jgi:hypothetical protein